MNYRDGSFIGNSDTIQNAFSGTTAVLEDAHGPFGGTSLQFPLGPFQSSTDAELAGIRGALSRLTRSKDWQRATIVTDS